MGQPHSRAYFGAGLIVKRVGGNERPLELSSRQSGGSRLIIMGFNVSASSGSSQVFFSNGKWDANVGRRVLWDDYEQQARYADDSLMDFTPISTGMPVVLIEGFTPERKGKRWRDNFSPSESTSMVSLMASLKLLVTLSGRQFPSWRWSERLPASLERSFRVSSSAGQSAEWHTDHRGGYVQDTVSETNPALIG